MKPKIDAMAMVVANMSRARLRRSGARSPGACGAIPSDAYPDIRKHGAPGPRTIRAMPPHQKRLKIHSVSYPGFDDREAAQIRPVQWQLKNDPFWITELMSSIPAGSSHTPRKVLEWDAQPSQ